jgi:hypothetical protein
LRTIGLLGIVAAGANATASTAATPRAAVIVTAKRRRGTACIAHVDRELVLTKPRATLPLR